VESPLPQAKGGSLEATLVAKGLPSPAGGRGAGGEGAMPAGGVRADALSKARASMVQPWRRFVAWVPPAWE